MTVAVAGLWELGHAAPISEAPLWEHPLRDFAVDEWHMSPVAGIAGFEVTEWADAFEMIHSLRSRFPLVFVSEQADSELSEFIHPASACYVFGKANWSPFLSMATAEDHAIRIDTALGSGQLWPHQCLVAALWHRRSQWP